MIYPTLDLSKIKFDPYPYQVDAVNKLIAWALANDITKINTFVSLIQSGKTFCCCAAMGILYKLGLRIWVIVDREELIEQWWNSFFELNPDIPRKDCWFLADGKTMMLNKQIQFVQVQTLTSRFKQFKDRSNIAPDVIFIDEAHGVATHMVINDLINTWNPKQINITATPVFHGKKKETYAQRFPLWEFPSVENPLKGTGDMLWHIGANSKMMLDLKRWKKPVWIVGSEELSDITFDRFKGVKIRGSDYDSNSQADVMIDLIPEHIQEWKDNKGDDRSTIWYCVNQLHCLEMVKSLIKEGRKVALVLSKLTKEAKDELTSLGVIFNRKEAIRKYKSGELTDLVNCQCLTTGFSAAIGSCAVWVRRTMSVGLFCQMSGRVLTYHPDWDTALLMDLAGNLGVHKVFPETIDWLDFNPSKLLFQDPNQVVCRKCGHRHDSTPKPKHSNKHVKFSVKLGQFVYPENYTEVKEILDTDHVITCNSCNTPVYFNHDKLTLYSAWLSSVRAAVMDDQKPDKFKGNSVGISIGIVTNDCDVELTIGDMYNVKLWSLLEDEKELLDDDGNVIKIPLKEDEAPKNYSAKWAKIRARQLEALEGKELRNKKLSKLTLAQREYVEKNDVKKLLETSNINVKYRAALSYMYINNQSPIKAYSYWNKNPIDIPEDLVNKTKGLIQTNNDTLLLDWLNWYELEANVSKILDQTLSIIETSNNDVSKVLKEWFDFYSSKQDNPLKPTVKLALKNLYNGDLESYEMLRNWLSHHYEVQTSYSKKGVIMNFLKMLSELKIT